MPSTCGITVDTAELTDPGLEPSKQINEDAVGFSVTANGLLAVVCDGMGGHSHGKAASEAALKALLDHVQASPSTDARRDLLGDAVRAANRAVYAYGGDAAMMGRPGSTCVAVLLHAAGAEVAHVGDSRVHLLREGKLYPLTRDHSVVQQMIDAGMLSVQEAKEHPDANRITRALGMQPEVDVELRMASLPVQAGDLFLLSTDGLTDLVDDAEIESILVNRAPSGLETAAGALVDLAKLRGGHDNITVQVLRVTEVDRSGFPAARPEPAPLAHAPAPTQNMDYGSSPRAAPAPRPLSPTQPDVQVSVPAATVPDVATSPHAGQSAEASSAVRGGAPQGMGLPQHDALPEYPPQHDGMPRTNGGGPQHHTGPQQQHLEQHPGSPHQQHAAQQHPTGPMQQHPQQHAPGQHHTGPRHQYAQRSNHAGSAGRWLLLGAAAALLFVLVLVCLWWLYTLLVRSSDDSIPLPNAPGKGHLSAPADTHHA